MRCYGRSWNRLRHLNEITNIPDRNTGYLHWLYVPAALPAEYGDDVRKRYGRKVDANQKDIVRALRKAGRIVFEIEEPFDLLIDNIGEWVVMEIKNPDTHARQAGGSKMTEKQDEILETLSARVLVAETVDEALNLVLKRW